MVRRFRGEEKEVKGKLEHEEEEQKKKMWEYEVEDIGKGQKKGGNEGFKADRNELEEEESC